MKHKVKRLIAVFALICMAIGICYVPANAKALNDIVTEEEDTEQGGGNKKGDNISVSVKLVSQDGEKAKINIEIYNGQKDFTGKVLFMVQSDAVSPTVYETEISIAEKSTKNFDITIPAYMVQDSRKACYVALYNSKGTLINTYTFTKVFANGSDEIQLGILSDNYGTLSYLDMAGYAVFVMNDDYYLKSNEVTKNNLPDIIDTLDMLVIDNYDISTLPKDQISLIQEWTKRGGKLIIGTGINGDKQFSAFDTDFIGCSAYSDQTYNDKINYLDGYQNMLSIVADSKYFYDGDVGAYVAQVGSGSISVVAFSFSDKALLDTFAENDPSFYLGELYGVSYAHSNYILDNQNYYDISSYEGNNVFSMMEGKSGFKVGRLNLIILFYVILVGPILYLILMAVKKRELYWALVPAIAVFFVGIIFLVGLGYRVKGTNTYEITVIDAGTGKMNQTYVSSYRADNKEWEIPLKESYRFAGPAYETYAYGSNIENYDYKIINSASGIKLGYKPDSSFDQATFRAYGDHTDVGNFDYQIDLMGTNKGYVVNNTKYDYPVLMVTDGDVYLYLKDVKAGEKVDLNDTNRYLKYSGSTYSSGPYSVYYMMERPFDAGDYETARCIGALYYGYATAYDYTDFKGVFGAVPKYEKSVLGEDSVSYGCVYSKN